MRFDLCDVGRWRLGAIEWNAGTQSFAQTNGKRVHHAAAKAESDRAEFACALRVSFDPVCCGDEIFSSLRAIELAEHLGRLFFIAGIPADGRQCIRRERDEVRDSQTPRNIANVRIQAAILVHHQDRRKLAGSVCRPHQITLSGRIALRRRVAQVFSLNSGVGG